MQHRELVLRLAARKKKRPPRYSLEISIFIVAENSDVDDTLRRSIPTTRSNADCVAVRVRRKRERKGEYLKEEEAGR